MSKKHTGKEKKAVPEDRSDEQTAESEQAADITDDVNDDAQAPGDGSIKIETGDEVETPDQTDVLEEQVVDLNDQLLRKQADFENFRKRMFHEREEAAKYANQRLLADLVEVVDNFERAIKSSEESKDFDSFHKGIELIEKQFMSLLESKWGLKRFDSAGEEFDPEKHEAIAVEESPDNENQMVVEDYQKGYMLHDRVLRHAKVKVSQPASQSPAPEQEVPDGASDD